MEARYKNTRKWLLAKERFYNEMIGEVSSPGYTTCTEADILRYEIERYKTLLKEQTDMFNKSRQQLKICIEQKEYIINTLLSQLKRY